MRIFKEEQMAHLCILINLRPKEDNIEIFYKNKKPFQGLPIPSSDHDNILNSLE